MTEEKKDLLITRFKNSKCAEMKTHCETNNDPIMMEDWCNLNPNLYLRKGDVNPAQCFDLGSLIQLFETQLIAEQPFIDPTNRQNINIDTLMLLCAQYINAGYDLPPNLERYVFDRLDRPVQLEEPEEEQEAIEEQEEQDEEEQDEEEQDEEAIEEEEDFHFGSIEYHPNYNPMIDSNTTLRIAVPLGVTRHHTAEQLWRAAVQQVDQINRTLIISSLLYNLGHIPLSTDTIYFNDIELPNDVTTNIMNRIKRVRYGSEDRRQSAFHEIVHEELLRYWTDRRSLSLRRLGALSVLHWELRFSARNT
jgi:hypothetical protein